MKNATKLPIEFSYRITDNFYAGECPFRRTVEEGLPKLQQLIDFGIKHFIDLTEPPDNLTTYREHLLSDIEYKDSRQSIWQYRILKTCERFTTSQAIQTCRFTNIAKVVSIELVQPLLPFSYSKAEPQSKQRECTYRPSQIQFAQDMVRWLSL